MENWYEYLKLYIFSVLEPVQYTVFVYNVYRHTPKLAMRTNIDIDDKLIQEAFSLCDVRTKKELVHLALQEFIKAKKKKDLLDLSGKIKFHDGYDYKTLRGN